MMPGAPPQWAIFLLMNDLDRLGGASQLLCTLAVHLQRAGIEVAVFTEHPPDPDNRYACALRGAGIPLNAAVLKVEADALPRALLPARFVVAIATALLTRSSFEHAWQRTGERLNRLLVHRRFSRRGRRAFCTAVSAARHRGLAVLTHVHRGPNGVRWASSARTPVVYLENSTPALEVGVDWWFATDPSTGSNVARGWRQLRRVVDRIDLVISGSQRSARGLREEVRPRGPIAVVPWMVDPVAAAAHRGGSRASTPFVVGTAGRLEPEKGHTFLLEAMARTLQATPARLILAGDGSRRAALEELAAELDIRQHVEFLGTQDDAGMQRFWSSIDLFVLPSLREGTPLAALEAMARCVPVLATNVGGVGELLEDGRCGVVVAPSAPGLLAEAIIGMAANPSQREALAQAGYDRFQSVHSPPAALPVWLRTYARVLGAEAPPIE